MTKGTAEEKRKHIFLSEISKGLEEAMVATY